MTHEEAIKELKEDIELYIPLHGTIDDVDRDLPDGRLITALEMGIKALEQEPCEDAISRQEVLDLCDSKDPDYKVIHFKEDVECLPPVNPHLKTGHWISMNTEKQSHTKNGMTIESVKCSECDEWLTASDEYACYGRYCPNCGYRMVEPQESEG